MAAGAQVIGSQQIIHMLTPQGPPATHRREGKAVLLYNAHPKKSAAAPA